MADKKWRVKAETCDIREGVVFAPDEEAAVMKFLTGDTIEETTLSRAHQTEFDVYSVEEIA